MRALCYVCCAAIVAAEVLACSAPDDQAAAADLTSDTSTLEGVGNGLSATCPGTGDPAACDDGTGSTGTGTACPLARIPNASKSFHLQVTGTGFAAAGACVYVVGASCSTVAGDIIQFSGGDGTSAPTEYDASLVASPLCFRLLDVMWDTAWEDNGLSTGGPIGRGGNVLAASGRAHALIAWARAFARTSPTSPFCGRGSSGGSSELLYELFHASGDAIFDHVQLQHSTPFARFDKGCTATIPDEGANVVCSGLPATTSPQYGPAAGFVSGIVHERAPDGTNRCDQPNITLSPTELAALHAMSIVTPGLAPLTLRRTTVTALMCSMAPNATQGQAVEIFGVNADLASAGMASYTGIIDVQVATPFNGCAAGARCPPRVFCSAACSGETFGSVAANRQAALNDMRANCVLRH
jgi:hypothetical protein